TRSTQSVRLVCGSGTDRQSAFPQRHASGGGSKAKYLGRLGSELDAEAGRDAARTAALGALAAARQHLGSLDRVIRVIRLGVFMATSGDFFDQPKIADGASDLLRDIFGVDKLPVRLVIGVASLPLG